VEAPADQSPIQLGTLSPVASHDLFAWSFGVIRALKSNPTIRIKHRSSGEQKPPTTQLAEDSENCCRIMGCELLFSGRAPVDPNLESMGSGRNFEFPTLAVPNVPNLFPVDEHFVGS
jgi:hypothetical protein